MKKTQHEKRLTEREFKMKKVLHKESDIKKQL